jgi:hypothetical protein
VTAPFHPKAEERAREAQWLMAAANSPGVGPRPLDPLERIAGSLDQLVTLQSQAQPLDAAEVILEWLSTIDPADLDHSVMLRRIGLGVPVMHTVLEELKDRAGGYRA